jgi:hypothetical protein
MPTGYTAAIKDGISFEQYVWTCARAFGALVLLRDDTQAPIPERFESSTYHVAELAKAKDRLATLNAMSMDDAVENEKHDYKAATKSYLARLDEKGELRTKYMAMLGQVRQWIPPTPDHQGLKDLMVQQIEQSIEFDCNTHYMELPAAILGGQLWLAQRTAEAECMVAYHADELAKEVSRTEDRNGWLQALRKSVPPPAA